MKTGLCRISTGGGFATRQLYTDSEETIIDATRPILLNGIDTVATRGDLLDRALVVTLPRVDAYRAETEIWKGFDEAAPKLFGAMLDALSTATRLESETKTSQIVT